VKPKFLGCAFDHNPAIKILQDEFGIVVMLQMMQPVEDDGVSEDHLDLPLFRQLRKSIFQEPQEMPTCMIRQIVSLSAQSFNEPTK
jgi:hypothetical protein